MPRERKYVLLFKIARGAAGFHKLVPLTTNMEEEEKHFAEVTERLQEGSAHDMVLKRKIRCTQDPEEVVRKVQNKFRGDLQNGWIKAKITDISKETREQCKK
jgi:hypothetical protein